VYRELQKTEQPDFVPAYLERFLMEVAGLSAAELGRVAFGKPERAWNWAQETMDGLIEDGYIKPR
jgi:hypothetical protein